MSRSSARKKSVTVPPSTEIVSTPSQLVDALLEHHGSLTSVGVFLERSTSELRARQTSAGAADLQAASLPPQPVPPLPPSPLETPASTDRQTAVTEDHELTREQLEVIKAKTMYNMVETLDNNTTKLLLLSNDQADLLANDEDHLSKMLNALEVGEPQLIINLLPSGGFRTNTNQLVDEEVARSRMCTWAAGFIHNRPPFLSRDDERDAEGHLDAFMAEVLIPLAAQTSAVVICSADTAECVLASSFSRMYQSMRAQWGTKCPFTLLSHTANVEDLYRNRKSDAHWREVKEQSRAWRLREKTLLETLCDLSSWKEALSNDLDPNASCYIITEGMDRKKKKIDRGPHARLMNELVRYLSSTLPSLAVKTGFCDMEPIGTKFSSNLDIASDACQSGTPTLFLDVRQRKAVGGSTRQELIDNAKAAFTVHADALLEAGTPETFECCSLAYFHDVLVGDGNHATAEFAGRGDGQRQEARWVPLHEAISLAESDGDQAKEREGNNSMSRATVQQTNELASWLVNRIFSDAWAVLDDREQREKNNESYQSLWGQGDRILNNLLAARILLSSPNFYHLNLYSSSSERSQRLVNQLVRMDRLPKENPLAGLLLLREAWRDYDVAMLLALRYKRICKTTFLAQLLLGWLAIGCATVSTYLRNHNLVCVCDADNCSLQELDEDTVADAAGAPDVLDQVVFGLAVLLGVTLAFDSLLNAEARWLQLRSSAGALESITWNYRARVGAFEIEENWACNTRQKPERALMRLLNAWREELYVEANLATSELKKQRRLSVYKHFQDSGQPGAGEDGIFCDDFQSPVQPARYIGLRVKPMLRFYQKRIPMYARWSITLKMAIVLLGASASVLARYGNATFVVLVTSASAAVTSWMEFSDTARKTQRYTRAVTSLEVLLAWWTSLSEVEQASKIAIANLVLSAEQIIAEEQTAWTKTAKRAATQRLTEGNGEGGAVATKEQGGGTTRVPRPVVIAPA